MALDDVATLSNNMGEDTDLGYLTTENRQM